MSIEKIKRIDEEIRKCNNERLNLYKNNIGLLLIDVYGVLVNNKTPRLFKQAYYVDETLHINIDSKLFILVNLNEKYTITHNGKETIRLLNIQALSTLFRIYFRQKGITPYFNKSIEHSCLKHILC